MDIARTRPEALRTGIDDWMIPRPFGSDHGDVLIDDIVQYLPEDRAGTVHAARDDAPSDAPAPEVSRPQQAVNPFVPAPVAVLPAIRQAAATRTPPSRRAPQRLQSGAGTHRQMGGVSQTNRFFSRRQFM